MGSNTQIRMYDDWFCVWNEWLLCGFHEPACASEFALYDAVAQFKVCKKAITLSIDALRKISSAYSVLYVQIK